MLTKVLFVVVLALLGLGQAIAIRRLVSHRRARGKGLAYVLVGGGAALLVASVATRWLPELPLPPWFGGVAAVLAATAMLAGIALLEAARPSP